MTDPSGIRCSLCGKSVDPNARGTHRLKTGWVENRAAGGGHAIRLAVEHDKWACKACVDREANHVSALQESFL